MTDEHILPDRLQPDLPLWFVGTAAGPMSADRGQYYAHPGNRFWKTLWDIGLTPHRFAPREFLTLLDLGIGLTDICKTTWGVDSQLANDDYDVPGFAQKVDSLRPRGLAFTSKKAASLWLGRSTGTIKVGRQPKIKSGDPMKNDGAFGPAVFVLPSPSGLATRYWSLAPWQDVADWFFNQTS